LVAAALSKLQEAEQDAGLEAGGVIKQFRNFNQMTQLKVYEFALNLIVSHFEVILVARFF
jgi:hypothetical protein